jgi:hypothetical protein
MTLLSIAVSSVVTSGGITVSALLDMLISIIPPWRFLSY